MEATQSNQKAKPTSVDIDFKVDQCAGTSTELYQMTVTAGYLPAAGQDEDEIAERVGAAATLKHEATTMAHEVNKTKSEAEGEPSVVGELEVREQATGRCPNEATFSCSGRCDSGHRCCNDSGRCVPDDRACDNPPLTGKKTCKPGHLFCKTCGHRCLNPFAGEKCPQVPTTGEFTKHEFVFELSKEDGGMVKGYCHKDDREDFCSLKKTIVQQSLRKIKAAKPTQLNGAMDALQYADHTTFETSGIHPQNGKYRTLHEQRVRSDGILEMIETTTHEAQTLSDDTNGDGLEGDDERKETEAVKGSLKSN
jgi:hypothetical protein